MSSPRPTWLFVLPWALGHAGGVNEVVRNLYDEFSREGSYRPLVLTAEWAARSFETRVEQERECVAARLRAFPLSAGSWWRAPFGLVAWVLGLLRLARFMRSRHVSVANVQSVSESAFMFAVLRRIGAFRGKLVLSFHGLDLVSIVDSHGAYGRAMRFALRSADRLVFCSQALMREAEAGIGPADDRWCVVHNGVRDESAGAVSPDPGVPSGEVPRPVRVVSVGTYERKKGHDVLLEAFVRVRARVAGATLRIVGRRGPQLDELMNLAVDLGLGDAVRFDVDRPHGQTMRSVAESDLFVLASRYEPFGIAILEAGMLGVPVVASSVGGIPEIVRDGIDGILVPSEDPARLAEAIRHALLNRDATARRCEAFVRRIEKEFSWKNAAVRYLMAVEHPGGTSPGEAARSSESRTADSPACDRPSRPQPHAIESAH